MEAGHQPQLIQITPLPQVVPGSACLMCDVCCRFPEANSFLRPYFSSDEIRRAIACGADPAHFPDPNGCQVNLVPDPSGEGYLCPAFDPTASRCRIYEARPLDCQLYPLAVMRSADEREIVLGWDTKCPFLAESVGDREALGVGENGRRGNGPEVSIEEYAEKIARIIEQDEAIEIFAKNLRLIGRHQDDVVILRLLPKLTKRVHQPSLLTSRPSRHARRTAFTTRPLTFADRPYFERACASIDSPLAAYAFAPHMVWRALFSYSWAEIDGACCLFAEYADGVFMPLPPLGSGSFIEPLAQAFAYMRRRNKGSAVSRVENVPDGWKLALESAGFHVIPKDPDYLYYVEDLVRLAGGQYKSQRAACNRFMRERRYRYEPYDDGYRESCLELHRLWTAQQEARVLTPFARRMLEDSAEAHQEALIHYDALGLIGRVVLVDDAVRAYTFGYRRSRSVFCILFEVADRQMPGLAQFIFRAFCREAAGQGYRFINTMDDSGLDGLRRSKEAYRPLRLIPSYIVTERE